MFDAILSEIQEALGQSADLQVHRFQALAGDSNGALIYLKSFIDLEHLNQYVLFPLQQLPGRPADMEAVQQVLPSAGTKILSSSRECAQAVAGGQAVLLISGLPSALSLPLKKYAQRTLTEPENERVVQGPRDGFVESIWSNIGILRQRIKNPDFRFELITLDTRTSVELGIVYIEGIANEKIVAEVKSRLGRIQIDRLLSSGSIAEMIADSPLSPFPTHQVTERPDRLTSALLDGRIGIMLDGTPGIMIVPAVFWDFLKSPDDYIENPYFSSLMRLIRLSAHLITLLLPGTYVAVTTIHLGMLPQALAVIIAGARTRTPLPTAVELLSMELMIEVLREAGLRLPGAFGQTLGIIGALVIGEAAVTAGLIEPIIVVIVAFTTLASFVVPGYNAAISLRILRFPLILLSASLGFFGLILGAMFYLMHLVSLRSFGVPYFAPVAPLFLKDMKDMYVRLPWWQQARRPSYYRQEDQIMAGPEQKPGPKKEP